jgi:hypothetical protein
MFMWPCIVTNFLLIKPTGAQIFPNLFLSRKSTCFGQSLCPSSGVLHCTFGTGICHASLVTSFKLESRIKIFCFLCQCCRPAVDDGLRDCPKHVEFLDKNKFGKNSASVGFIKRDCPKRVVS